LRIEIKANALENVSKLPFGEDGISNQNPDFEIASNPLGVMRLPCILNCRSLKRIRICLP